MKKIIAAILLTLNIATANAAQDDRQALENKMSLLVSRGDLPKEYVQEILGHHFSWAYNSFIRKV